MARGRRNGCPVSIRNWTVEILAQDDAWVRIRGLTSLSRTLEGETEDGSLDVDVWSEPYVTKRSVTLEMEGRRVVDEMTSLPDPGQDLLDLYGEAVGCDGDATLRFIDPYGHGWIGEYVITSVEESTEEASLTLSWSLEQVGEAEPLRYTHVTGIAVTVDGKDSVTLSAAGGPALAEIAFTPNTASNRRFRMSSSARSVVRISEIGEDGFTLTPLSPGQAVITVTSVNHAKTGTLTVTVTE